MNPLRHDFIQSCLSSSTTDYSHPERSGRLSYLDIGCGGGIFASSAARLPSTQSVTAIDPTPLVIEVAKSHQRSDPALSPPKLQYLNCAIEDLPRYTSHTSDTSPDSGTGSSSEHKKREKKYDIITVFEVLEHIDSPSNFLDSALTHLKPGGWLVGSTISRSPTAWFTTKLIAEAPVIGVVPAGTHDWNKYINPSELQTYFETRAASGRWADFRTQGVIYVPMLGWRNPVQPVQPKAPLFPSKKRNVHNNHVVVAFKLSQALLRVQAILFHFFAFFFPFRFLLAPLVPFDFPCPLISCSPSTSASVLSASAAAGGTISPSPSNFALHSSRIFLALSSSQSLLRKPSPKISPYKAFISFDPPVERDASPSPPACGV
ncbi:Hexaprenyldihydroxybenzoate methyltransferase, mitochondrial [Exophiala xenobiotica]|nr:Hexaprenyldihydroxybenzoate methyltransferase, mitochondrial [Exophiala xenobiotica]